MKIKLTSILLIVSLVFTGCKQGSEGEKTRDSSSDRAVIVSEVSAAARDGQGNGAAQTQAGTITAGEWNDLDNWTFWKDKIQTEEFKQMPDYWSIFNNNRISVEVSDSENKPVINATVLLKLSGTTIFSARTDNRGKAELFPDLFQKSNQLDISKLSIEVGSSTTISSVKPFSEGVNKITAVSNLPSNKIEIAFVVDATGSMGDELEYLKTELVDVVSKVKALNPGASIATSSVFYRDITDSYVTRVSGFSSDVNVTKDFIRDQNADGGGDFPEAVHSALDKAVNELQWSTDARTRIMFLLLDAPPHYDRAVIADLQKSIDRAAQKGIKIIPITASGIDKETEFLMRFLAITTNGTYVFITDDSGVGNSHLIPTVGQYQVELLNNLMVRLINKYAE